MSCSNISFFTPVAFEKDRTFGQYLLEKVDGYFSLKGKRAFVISGIKSGQSYDAEMKDCQSSTLSKLFFTAIKIVSYLTLVIPAIMLFAKLILRSNYTFHLVEVKALSSNPPSSEKDIFVLGDVHGELDGFKDNLKEGKVLDGLGNWARGNTSILVQMGDVIDRGPKSLEAFDFLDKLQSQAEANGGKVIRLLGNHEAMILQRNYAYALASGLTIEQCEKLREKIIRDINSGKVILSWTDGEWLYTHAGCRSVVRESLKREILSERNGFLGLGCLIRSQDVTLDDIVKHLNSILKRAVNSNDYSHDVFKVGKSRGGQSPYGGVLWADDQEILASQHAKDLKQIRAHNPPRPNEEPIRITPSKRLINADAGLCKKLGNNNAFVQFHGKKILVHEKVRSISSLFLKRWKVREV